MYFYCLSILKCICHLSYDGTTLINTLLNTWYGYLEGDDLLTTAMIIHCLDELQKATWYIDKLSIKITIKKCVLNFDIYGHTKYAFV